MINFNDINLSKFESFCNEGNSIILFDGVGTITLEDKEGLRESLLICDKYVDYTISDYGSRKLNSCTTYIIKDRFIDSKNNLVLLVESKYIG